MSFGLKEFVEIPEFDNASEMLGWLIVQWRKTISLTRGLIIMDKQDLKRIAQAYDGMEEKLCQNKWPESNETKEANSHDSNL